MAEMGSTEGKNLRRGYNMDECCTCPKCGGQSWQIFKYRIVCMTCQIKISFEYSIVMSELVDAVNREDLDEGR